MKKGSCDAKQAAARYRHIVTAAIDALECFDSDDKVAQLFIAGLISQLSEVDRDYEGWPLRPRT